MEYAGKTIWITGASSGIGKAVAIEISKEKAGLILSGRNKKALVEVADQCKRHGSSVQIIPFDLGRPESVKKAARKVLSQGGSIDCLFHFGGISQRSLVAETPLELDRQIFETNFFGTVELTKEVLPRMIENGGGQIAVTSSIVGKFGFPYRSAYAASKHALQGFFESLRAENKQNNIRVSVIIPGRVRTSISQHALDRSGKAHGKMDPGLDKGITPGRSARIICRRLKKERKEIPVGGNELLMMYIRRFLPALFYYMSSKVKPL